MVEKIKNVNRYILSGERLPENRLISNAIQTDIEKVIASYRFNNIIRNEISPNSDVVQLRSLIDTRKRVEKSNSPSLLYSDFKCHAYIESDGAYVLI